MLEVLKGKIRLIHGWLRILTTIPIFVLNLQKMTFALRERKVPKDLS